MIKSIRKPEDWGRWLTILFNNFIVTLFSFGIGAPPYRITLSQVPTPDFLLFASQELLCVYDFSLLVHFSILYFITKNREPMNSLPNQSPGIVAYTLIRYFKTSSRICAFYFSLCTQV